MLRKIVIAAAASAALALAIAPTEASAHGWAGGHGWHGGWHAGWHHFGFRRFGFFPHRHVFFHRRFVGGPWYGYGTCWRWVPGPWGWHRAWVCGHRPYAWRFHHPYRVY